MEWEGQGSKRKGEWGRWGNEGGKWEWWRGWNVVGK